ncbi:hypothetical protein EDC39_10548 [Geothermobacter ehrlichii]|uniref:Alginate export domain-containing protein n=1 Tax=Geothermobacter ehrlichii TaxID=213224 RepID=A0A5D3WMB8_9BACT|nr:hypothetical protein [Geothermobacter ehrlichii]TYO98686.1 hypothetical protein EDC39_10548 [Geothermobacter ehrlichii]
MIRAAAILLLFFAVGGTNAFAQLQGVAKVFGLRQPHAASDQLPQATLLSGSLRLGTTLRPTTDWSLELAAEHFRSFASPPFPAGDPTANANRRLDLETAHDTSGHGRAYTAVDRLRLNWEGTDNALSLGRQAIGFGRIVLFSPLDVVAPFAPDVIDSEFRPGVDAIRIRHFLPSGDDLGLHLVFGREARLNSYLVSGSGQVAGIDLLGLAGSLRDRPMAGVGLAGDLGGLGWRVEASLFRGRRVGRTGGDPKETFGLAGVELWYRFAGDLSLLVDYLYNGAGTGNPEDYPRVYASAPFAEGMIFLAGHHYLLAAPAWRAHPLVELRGLLIWNLGDASWQLRPLTVLSLADNLELQLFWTLFRGEKPRQAAPLPVAVPRSEFGQFEDSGGLFLAWHF